MFIFNVIGETTFDMGPGAWISIAESLWLGMVVAVNVGLGLGVFVGSGISVGISVGVNATLVCVPEMLAASTVSAITVGRYPGGYGVGTGLCAGDAQPAKNPRRTTKRKSRRIMFSECRMISETSYLNLQIHIQSLRNKETSGKWKVRRRMSYPKSTCCGAPY
jgi:hypothetical protein